jgi:hypothetical protein
MYNKIIDFTKSPGKCSQISLCEDYQPRDCSYLSEMTQNRQFFKSSVKFDKVFRYVHPGTETNITRNVEFLFWCDNFREEPLIDL